MPSIRAFAPHAVEVNLVEVRTLTDLRTKARLASLLKPEAEKLEEDFKPIKPRAGFIRREVKNAAFERIDFGPEDIDAVVPVVAHVNPVSIEDRRDGRSDYVVNIIAGIVKHAFIRYRVLVARKHLVLLNNQIIFELVL